MSFTFQWPRFSDQFHADAIQMLDAALNKGNKPPVIADKIEVVELEMGTQPPELEIRDIGELTMDQFRGIFRLSYAGDAHIVLRTKVQANPLNHKQPDIHLMTGSKGMLAAKHPLVVPMLLRLSHFKLNAYVVLVVSKQKGITLVFKTDPLQNVDINSTFDSIGVIQKFIQREIEGQLRQMFREDLPGIIHRLSQQWVKAKVEAPYLDKRSTVLHPQPVVPTVPTSEPSSYRAPRSRSLQTPRLWNSSISHSRSSSGVSVSSVGRKPHSTISLPTSPPSIHIVPEGPTTFPDIENFDPTYGLRPEGIPAKSVFSSFRSLFSPNKGLADLAEEPSVIDETFDDSQSYDIGNWDDSLPDYPSRYSVSEAAESEYETVPAVGGGTVTRPRIYHAQSQIQSPSELPPHRGTSSSLHISRPMPRTRSYDYPTRSNGFDSTSLSDRISSLSGSLYNPYPLHSRSYTEIDSLSGEYEEEPPFAIPPSLPTFDHSFPRRTGSPSSVHTQPSRSSDMTHPVPTPPPQIQDDADIHIGRHRRLSLSSMNMDRFHSGSPPDQSYIPDPDPEIILRPTLNNSVSKLSTLSHSNHTLSPYTRTMEHFTVRSVPPREASSSRLASSVEKQPIKAKRKRTYRLGGKPAPPIAPISVNYAPSAPPSDFDASEMDRYFCSRDDSDASRYTDLPSSHIRRRFPYQPPP